MWISQSLTTSKDQFKLSHQLKILMQVPLTLWKKKNLWTEVECFRTILNSKSMKKDINTRRKEIKRIWKNKLKNTMSRMWHEKTNRYRKSSWIELRDVSIKPEKYQSVLIKGNKSTVKNPLLKIKKNQKMSKMGLNHQKLQTVRLLSKSKEK